MTKKIQFLKNKLAKEQAQLDCVLKNNTTRKTDETLTSIYKQNIEKITKKINDLCDHFAKSIVVVDAFDVYEKTIIKCTDCDLIIKK